MSGEAAKRENQASMAKRFQPRRMAAAGETVFGARQADPASRLAQHELKKRGLSPDARPEGTLIVGNGIFVKGEIESCQTLVVEGRVEASVTAENLKVRSGGVFGGRAVVEAASITGDFDGDLTVRGLLTIESSGRVSGTIRYAEIMIKTGGQIRGDIGVGPALVADEDVA